MANWNRNMRKNIQGMNCIIEKQENREIGKGKEKKKINKRKSQKHSSFEVFVRNKMRTKVSV